MNVLIIGLGSIAQKHIEALRSIDTNIQIYALRSGHGSKNIEGVINIYSLDDTSIQFDFVIISNPTHLHYASIDNLISKGYPLFIEKPTVHSLKNIDSLTQKIDAHNIITYVACNLRFHPCINFLKEKLDKDRLTINELNVYCGSFLPKWRTDVNFKESYSANRAMGGGVHLDLFHELDYTTWLFGFPNKSHSILRSVSSLDIDAFDYANYILEYDHFTASIILNYYRRTPKREIEIIFENDMWSVDLINNKIMSDSGECIFKDSEFNIKKTYSNQLQYFISSLKNKEVPMNSFKQSLENLKIILHDEK